MKGILTGILFLFTTVAFSQQKYNLIQNYLERKGDEWLDLYRYLHQNPELSREESNTASLLRQKIRSYGYRLVDSLGYQSFAAILENGDGPVILYRTDMDALPIKEETGLDYSSNRIYEKEGAKIPAMHACGHDLHMSVWLGLAAFMAESKKYWKGTIVFLAQSAEETGQGAKSIVASPNFKKLPRPDILLAIHTQPELEIGTFGLCDSYSMAAVDMMKVTIFGKGGHGAAPEKTIDPIVMSARFVSEIQTIVSRNLSSREPAVITVGAIHGGTAGNIIPDKVELKLTIRSFSEESRKKILDRIKAIGDGIALSAGMDKDHLPIYDLGDMSIPAVYNDKPLGDRIEKIFRTEYGFSAVSKSEPVMIGEDFGVYRKQFPSSQSYMMWAGVSFNKTADRPGLHSAKFAPEYDRAIPKSIRLISSLLLELMQK
jgi:amidohydrolase